MPPKQPHNSLLRRLGIVGYDRAEPMILAALATETPLLLIGPHGTAKSLLLTRLAQALGLQWRHYNASLVNYDDLIGYPVPEANGTLRFVQTPASIWDADAVFIDELSRARPDMLNRLFPIIHERVVQGMPLPRLRFRWSAMNPPAREGEEGDAGSSYLGSEQLDPALADRFGFVVEVPAWPALAADDQDAIITASDSPPGPEACRAVTAEIAAIQRELPLVLEYAGPAIAEVVRNFVRHAADLGLHLSGRRAAMLYRNIAAVHAARITRSPTADIVGSSWLAVSASLPQRAQGHSIDAPRLMLAHDAAWKVARLDAGDPRRALACEPDPTRRAIRAALLPALSLQERSAYVADGLAHTTLGGRHALGHWLVERGHAASLMTAVAEQCGDLYAVVASKQDVATSVSQDSPAWRAWQHLTKRLADLGGSPDEPFLGNVLPALFAGGVIAQVEDVDLVLESWKRVRALLGATDCPASTATEGSP